MLSVKGPWTHHYDHYADNDPLGKTDFLGRRPLKDAASWLLGSSPGPRSIGQFVQRASSGRVLLAVSAGVLLLVALSAGCTEDEDQAVEVVASMAMVPDSGDNSVLLLLPTNESSQEDAIERATAWANERGWSGEPIQDARLDLVEDSRPAWAKAQLTKPNPGGDLGVMWIGSAEAYLAEPSVEATELLRRSDVTNARDREDFVVVWELTLQG